jgi:hypothetical protein
MGQRVPKPMHIVALWKVRAVMGTPAFGSDEGSGDDRFRDIEQ